MFVTATAVCLLLGLTNPAVPEPNPYILSFPTTNNPLNIKVDTVNPEKNYIILIGDWGAHDSTTSDVKVQTAIANKMKTFYESQKSNGMNLLFVGTVGDNFYYDGQNCQYYTKRWTDMYGEIATDYPWLAVMGNHDWGQDDAHAICAWGMVNIPYTDPITEIPYGGNQLNNDKKGCNPSGYYLPDYGYYYRIDELNFEWIGLEESVTICPSDFGGQNFKDCNDSSKIGCNYLGEMRDASEKMMIQRANISTATNFILSQHYPQNGKRLQDTFISSRGNKASSTIAYSIYGHSHAQECARIDSKGECDVVLTGGGGGCCSENTLRGFFVIGFDKNKNMIQPYKINDKQISCQYPCGADITKEERIRADFIHCCYSDNYGEGKDECKGFEVTKCPNYY